MAGNTAIEGHVGTDRNFELRVHTVGKELRKSKRGEKSWVRREPVFERLFYSQHKRFWNWTLSRALTRGPKYIYKTHASLKILVVAEIVMT